MSKCKIFVIIFLLSFSFLESVEVKSILFVNNIEEASNLSSYYKDQINFKGLSLKDRETFNDRITPFIGSDISMDLLSNIQKEVLLYYKKKEKVIVSVMVPANQDITDGNICFVIIEGKLGTIKTEGAKYYSDKQILKNFSLKEDQILDSSVIDRDLFFINRSPYRSVDIVYEKGEKVGYTDVSVMVNDSPPVRLYAGYDYSGYQIAGNSRGTLGVNLGNLFWSDHQLNCQVMSAGNISDWSSLFGSYVIPFSWKNDLNIFGTYVKSEPNDQNDDLKGKYKQLSGRYIIPFQSLNRYNHNIIFGYDFKRTNNFLNVGGFVFENYIDISQFLFRYELSEHGKRGSWEIGASIYLSPGNMTRYNNNSKYEQLRSGTKSNYIYGTVNFDFLLYIFKYFIWSTRSYIQYSSGKLMPLEELSLGGMFSVRGYAENEVVGDRGLYIRNELRTLELSFRRKKDIKLQVLGFCDFGYTNDADQNLFGKDSYVLFSAGPGIRFSYKDNLNIKFDYGFAFRSVEERTAGRVKNSQAHVSVYVQY